MPQPGNTEADRNQRVVQFQAVHWMLRRERDLGPRLHPTVRSESSPLSGFKKQLR